MARTAALEAARAEAPATPVRESAAVGAVGYEIADIAPREFDQSLPVNSIYKLYFWAHTSLTGAELDNKSPLDHNEITVTNDHDVVAVAPFLVVVAAVAVDPVPEYVESQALPVAWTLGVEHIYLYDQIWDLSLNPDAPE